MTKFLTRFLRRSKAPERASGLKLIAGLGNPGYRYRFTRHNVGFLVVERLGEEFGLTLDKKKFKAHYGRGRVAGHEALIMEPQAFMNVSGEAVARFADYFRVPPADIVVVHDDLDLEFGRLKVKFGGGTGGHKGLNSIVRRLGTKEFGRVRMGIGRPPTVQAPSDYVLAMFTHEEMEVLPEFLENGCEALAALLTEGPGPAMNRWNAPKAALGP